MGDMEIISETPINSFQLKQELQNIKKRDKELNFRSNKTEEYLSQIEELKNVDGLYEKLVKLEIPRLKESHIHKIVDLTPSTVNELKVILQSYTITINNDSMKKIIDAVNEFLKKE